MPATGRRLSCCLFAVFVALTVAFAWIPQAEAARSSRSAHTRFRQVDHNVTRPAPPRVTSPLLVDDLTPPTTTDNADADWHRAFTLTLTSSDAGSGVASTWYRIGSGPWVQGTSVPLSGSPKRAGFSGVREVSYYSIDAAGNAEAVQSCSVKLDSRPPSVTDDADGLTHTDDVTVSVTSADEGSGVTAVFMSLDGGPWRQSVVSARSARRERRPTTEITQSRTTPWTASGIDQRP